MKKINFILPVASRNPIGGFKVIYEYANRLINDGYAINIILPATLLWEEKSFKEKIKGIVRYLYFKIDKKNICHIIGFLWIEIYQFIGY